MIVSTGQVVRHPDAADLARQTARRLLDTLVDLQADGRIPQLCLAGGRSAMAVYAEFAELVPSSDLDPSRLELWWSDERFLPADDPERNAGPALALLARSFAVDPARTHSMPSADGIVDADASANTYAKELGDTVFDLCLLGMGPDGHVASIFPHHPSFAESTHTVIGVDDAPKPPAGRISLTVPTLNRSREVWFLVVGDDKQDAVARSVAGDPEVPAGVTRGTENTVWFLDRAAAGRLPYHQCSF